MQKLSVIITTFNEQSHIDKLIASVKFADQILIVDSYSTDQTLPLLKKYDFVEVLQHKYESPAKQKNWIIPQAKHPWILLLDADERVTEALKKEIEVLLKEPPKEKTAFWIYRQNHFLGKPLKHIWKKDKVVRLFMRDLHRYKEVAVHEEIDIKNTKHIGVLKEKLLHFTYKDTAHFIAKLDRYADYFARSAQLSILQKLYGLTLKPIARFLKHYIVECGFLDGYRGFVLSVLMAYGVLLRYVKAFASK